jgi:hypothetical protein
MMPNTLNNPPESPQAWKYENVLPIAAYNSSCWLIEFAAHPATAELGPNQLLQIWHKDTKIEDVVESMKNQFSASKFTVAAVDVGSVWVYGVEQMLSNGRKLNQNMEVVI